MHLRMHHYVKDLNTAWKNGVVLKRNNTQAEIVSLYAAQKIRIRVKGKENKSFLDIIIEEFEKLHAQFEGIKVDKKIPCICPTCQGVDWKGKEYFKYEDLKRAYHNNVSEIQCRISFQLVNVHRLINETLVVKQIEKLFFEKKHVFIKPSIDKAALKALIIKNELDEVFDKLLEQPKDQQLENDIILLNSRWLKNERHFHKNTIGRDAYNIEHEKVKDALLSLISGW